MNEPAKLTVTKDSFIFSINQAYEARIQSDGNFNSHLKFEPFLEKTWGIPQHPDINSFKKTLGEIIEHHYSKLPNYRRNESVNIENISWFSHSVASLFADIGYLVTAYTGHGFSSLPTPQIPRTNSSKNIIIAIKKYLEFKSHVSNGEKFSLFPLISEDNVNLDELYSQELWSLIFYFIKKTFGHYVDLMSLYATWKYSIKLDSSDVVDWNVRPPCGDLYRKQFKHLFEKDYFKNNSKKIGAGINKNDSKPPKNAPVDENASEGLTKPSFKERKERPRRPERGPQPNQEEVIAKALLEVELAIKKMNKDKNLQEITLAPQNSFIRRQQHVVISDGGFDTESRGEDENRCVCIKRK